MRLTDRQRNRQTDRHISRN